jgi:hypothetical protein
MPGIEPQLSRSYPGSQTILEMKNPIQRSILVLISEESLIRWNYKRSIKKRILIMFLAAFQPS